MDKLKFNKEQLKEAVVNNYSIAGVLRFLGLNPAGGNYRTIHNYLLKWDIDTTHFTGQLWNKGKYHICNPAKPLKEILVENSDY